MKPVKWAELMQPRDDPYHHSLLGTGKLHLESPVNAQCKLQFRKKDYLPSASGDLPHSAGHLVKWGERNLYQITLHI